MICKRVPQEGKEMDIMVQYESAQAQMEEQMRKAAVWRMQRTAMDAHKANRKQAKASQKRGSWMNTIRQAPSGRASGGKTEVVGIGIQAVESLSESFSNN
jgi:protein subunit release factor B